MAQDYRSRETVRRSTSKNRGLLPVVEAIVLSLVTTTAVIGGGVVLPVAVALVFTLPVIGLNAFALMKLWNWFLVPAFALPSLAFTAAIGIVLILKLVSDYAFRQGIDKDVEKWANISTAFLRPVFAVLTGWVALNLF